MSVPYTVIVGRGDKSWDKRKGRKVIRDSQLRLSHRDPQKKIANLNYRDTQVRNKREKKKVSDNGGRSGLDAGAGPGLSFDHPDDGLLELIVLKLVELLGQQRA